LETISPRLKPGDALKFGALNDPALAACGCSTTEPSTLCAKERCYNWVGENIGPETGRLEDVLLFKWIEEVATTGQYESAWFGVYLANQRAPHRKWCKLVSSVILAAQIASVPAL
jgi:hypothetical protein